MSPNDPYDLLNRINRATGVTSAPSGPWKGPESIPRQGQTRSSLIEDFGRPEKVDVTVTAKGRKEVLKFFATGANRFRLKVTVENGVVTGWQSKG